MGDVEAERTPPPLPFSTGLDSFSGFFDEVTDEELDEDESEHFLALELLLYPANTESARMLLPNFRGRDVSRVVVIVDVCLASML